MIFTSHFNFFKNHYRERLLDKFVSTYPECKVVTYTDTDNIIFIKENILNNLIAQYIDNTEYIFWIDYDLEFKDNNWYNKAIEKLKNGFDIIQPFSISYHENKHYILEQKQPGYVYAKQILNRFGHCGFAWGMTKKTFLQLKGLYEFNIFGSGDSIMTRCFTQTIIPKFNEKTSEKFAFYPFSKGHCDSITKYYDSCKNLRTTFLEGTVIHKYHGELWRRYYTQRYKFYEQNNFDPYLMLFKENNILKIKPEYSNLKKDAELFLKFKETIK